MKEVVHEEDGRAKVALVASSGAGLGLAAGLGRRGDEERLRTNPPLPLLLRHAFLRTAAVPNFLLVDLKSQA